MWCLGQWRHTNRSPPFQHQSHQFLCSPFQQQEESERGVSKCKKIKMQINLCMINSLKDDVGRPITQPQEFQQQKTADWPWIRPGTHAAIKGELERLPGGSSQATLLTLLALWFRDHHNSGPRLLNPVAIQPFKKRNFEITAFVKQWLGWWFSRWTL